MTICMERVSRRIHALIDAIELMKYIDSESRHHTATPAACTAAQMARLPSHGLVTSTKAQRPDPLAESANLFRRSRWRQRLALFDDIAGREDL